MHASQRLSPVGQKFTFFGQWAPILGLGRPSSVEKRHMGGEAVWKRGAWQKSSRRKGVEQAQNLRLGVQIPTSQSFILWQLLEFLRTSNRYDTIDAPTISLFCGETRCRWQNSTIMKNTSQNKLKAKRASGLRPEYHFDYAKAKPNRFAGRARPGSVAVLLDPDVARVVAEWQITGGKNRPPALPRDPKTTHRNRR